MTNKNQKQQAGLFILFILLCAALIAAPGTAPAAARALPETAGLSGGLKVHFIDVGQGDAELIQTPEGLNILIDGGESSSGVLAYLQGLGIPRIDVMVATHPHSDHIGGLVQVLRAMPVGKIYTNGQPHTTPVYDQFLEAIIAGKVVYGEVKRGDTIPAGSLNLQVLSPAALGSDINENSIVLQLVYGRTTFLLMGDAGRETEASLLASGLPLKADILKVGHHGSKSGSTPAFLQAARPALAIYSAGLNNSYHHPAPQTVAALSAAGVQVDGTDKDGSIVVSADPNGYRVDTAKVDSRAPPALIPASIPAVKPAAPAAGGLQITSVSNPVAKGAYATLEAKTSPGASCSIKVYYKSGASTAAGLGSKAADASGRVSWTWKVGSRTTPGTWRIVVQSTANGSTRTQETSFTVR